MPIIRKMAFSITNQEQNNVHLRSNVVSTASKHCLKSKACQS